MFLSPAITALLILSTAVSSGAGEDLVREGRQLYRQGSMKEALGLFEKAIAAGASDARLFYETGRCLDDVRDEPSAGDQMMSRAIPMLESSIDATPPPNGPGAFYYLSTIYIHELGQGMKGVPLAQQAVKLYEDGSFAELTEPDSLFQMGRLFEMASRKVEAVGFYEKAIAGYDSSGDPDTGNLVIALKETAFSRASKQEWTRAADHYERLLDMTTLPERERFSAGIVMLRADRLKAGEKALEGFSDDALATEASYILHILHRFRDLGSPGLPAEPDVKDDAWLQQSILEAAADLGAIRSTESEQAEETRNKRIEKMRAEQTVPRGKGTKFGAPPKPIILRNQGPVVPPSEERLAAERRFFGLMAEYVRRGNLVRNFALSAGIAQLIFR